MKNKNFVTTLVLLAIIMVVGVSYAFFSYTRTSIKDSQLIAGEIYLHYNESTDVINLVNAFPESDETAREQSTNHITFTIDGVNTSNKILYYEISLIDGNEESGKTRLKDGHLKFDLVETAIVDGVEVTNTVLSAVSYDEINNKVIWGNAIPSSTTNEITITYQLRMWISDEVVISDTLETADYTSTSFANSYASVKVAVNGVLRDKTETNYYSNMSQAISVINNSLYENEFLKTTEEEAGVALSINNEVPTLVLLKDNAVNDTLEINSNMALNLNGNTLSFNSENGINVTGGDVIINGTVDGSKILLTNDNQKTTLAEVNNGSLTLNGGTYETTSNGVGTDANPNASILVRSTGSLNVLDAEIIASDNAGATLAGILVEDGGSAVVADSNIEVTSLDGLKSDGIRNYGTMTITNTSVSGYSNYTANAAKTDYATTTRGINNEGTMTLKNCQVYGTHSGIRSTGVLYIDGGTYEGYGHGGIYFAGANTTSYVKNAYIGMSDMRNGYDDGVAGTNKAGFYIGGASNITIYMDNCELWGPRYPLVMRVSGGEDNNSLYISNSTLKEGFTDYIRIATSRNIKVYIGSGNNFNAEDHVAYTSNAEETNTDYSTMFPEY